MRVMAALVLFLLTMLSSQLALALELTLDAGVGGSYTDNSLKTAENEESDYLTRLDGRFGLDHIGQSWLVDVNYSAIYTDYDRDTQSDSTELNGDASVQYEQFEDVLFWNASNSVRSVLSDQALQDTTDNRQNRYISTFSPELRIPVTKVDSLNTLASYSRISYEDANQQDSDRLGGRVGWVHRLSQVDSVELSWESYDVNFDDSVSDYNYYSTRLTYSSTLSRLNYTLVGGYNRTQRKNAEDSDGPYLSANFIYDSGISQWELTALREITDTSRGDNNEGLTDLGDSANAEGQVDIYEVIRGELSYTTEALCSVCVARVSLLSVKEEYEVLLDDNIELAARVGLDYGFSRRSTIGTSISYTDYSFTNNNPRADYGLQRYDVSFSHYLTRNFSMRLSAAFEKRDGDMSSDNYQEASGGISANYQFL